VKILGKNLELVPTGVPGLDELLHGGIPRGHTVSVFGAPGAGKTILAIQFLYNGATRYIEPGLYISLDESPDSLKRFMLAFGWNLDNLEKRKKLVILDISPFEHIYNIKRTDSDTEERVFSVFSLGDAIKITIEQIGAKRIAVDPLSALMFQYHSVGERRLAVMNLLQILRRETDCTSLLTLDLRTSALEREYQIEEYLTQGTILFQTIAQRGVGLTRVIRIEKMRGIDHDTQPHPYAITKQGIQVFSTEKIYIG
jgi:KaiC/GvpD/RAD55 family RecA-like ATPase